MIIPKSLQQEFADDFEVCSDCEQPFEAGTLDEQGRCDSCTRPAQLEEEDDDEEKVGTFTGPNALKDPLAAWCEALYFPLES